MQCELLCVRGVVQQSSAVTRTRITSDNNPFCLPAATPGMIRRAACWQGAVGAVARQGREGSQARLALPQSGLRPRKARCKRMQARRRWEAAAVGKTVSTGSPVPCSLRRAPDMARCYGRREKGEARSCMNECRFAAVAEILRNKAHLHRNLAPPHTQNFVVSPAVLQDKHRWLSADQLVHP